jgi:hypothetical protein
MILRIAVMDTSTSKPFERPGTRSRLIDIPSVGIEGKERSNGCSSVEEKREEVAVLLRTAKAHNLFTAFVEKQSTERPFQQIDSGGEEAA